MERAEQDSLVRRAQDGDVSAFEALIASHTATIRRFARGFAQSDHDADDLAQEALLKAFRSIGSYRRGGSFSTWLYAIIRNCYLDDLRSRATKERRREISDQAAQGQADRGPPVDALLMAQEERMRLWQALSLVPLEFRTAVILFDIEGLPYEEIAGIERVALGTVKSRLSRGREALRTILGAVRTPFEAGNMTVDSLVTPLRKGL